MIDGFSFTSLHNEWCDVTIVNVVIEFLIWRSVSNRSFCIVILCSSTDVQVPTLSSSSKIYFRNLSFSLNDIKHIKLCRSRRCKIKIGANPAPTLVLGNIRGSYETRSSLSSPADISLATVTLLTWPPAAKADATKTYSLSSHHIKQLQRLSLAFLFIHS